MQAEVPIEIKQAHANDLWTAPTEQLLARYMRDPRCTQGFFVVGWYGKVARPPKFLGRAPITHASQLQRLLQKHVDEKLSGTTKKITALVYDVQV